MTNAKTISTVKVQEFIDINGLDTLTVPNVEFINEQELYDLLGYFNSLLEDAKDYCNC
jgi:hypothetical protein